MFGFVVPSGKFCFPTWLICYISLLPCVCCPHAEEGGRGRGWGVLCFFTRSGYVREMTVFIYSVVGFGWDDAAKLHNRAPLEYLELARCSAPSDIPSSIRHSGVVVIASPSGPGQCCRVKCMRCCLGVMVCCPHCARFREPGVWQTVFWRLEDGMYVLALVSPIWHHH